MSAPMDSDLWREQQADAQPSLQESVADWLGIPLDDVTECDLMRFMDWVRDCAEMECAGRVW